MLDELKFVTRFLIQATAIVSCIPAMMFIAMGIEQAFYIRGGQMDTFFLTVVFMSFWFCSIGLAFILDSIISRSATNNQQRR